MNEKEFDNSGYFFIYKSTREVFNGEKQQYLIKQKL